MAPVRVRVILDVRSSLDHPLGDAVETLIRRNDAERLVDEVRGDDRKLAIEERGSRRAERTSAWMR
jgi:hypothetical protein